MILLHKAKTPMSWILAASISPIFGNVQAFEADFNPANVQAFEAETLKRGNM
jgi:hypothetical protein